MVLASNWLIGPFSFLHGTVTETASWSKCDQSAIGSLEKDLENEVFYFLQDEPPQIYHGNIRAYPDEIFAKLVDWMRRPSSIHLLLNPLTGNKVRVTNGWEHAQMPNNIFLDVCDSSALSAKPGPERSSVWKQVVIRNYILSLNSVKLWKINIF